MSTSNFTSIPWYPIWASEDDDDFYHTNGLGEELDALNDGLSAYELRLAPGYFCGAQVMPVLKYDACDLFGCPYDEYEERLNDGLYAALVKGEEDRINAWSREVLPMYGMAPYTVLVQMSNGETLYARA